MLAITAGAFDPIAFVTQASQMAMLVEGYASLGIDTTEAVAWANEGFTPAEARPWIAYGITPERADYHLNEFFPRTPEESAKYDELRTAGWYGYCW